MLPGLAKASFLGTYQRSPWKPNSHWPIKPVWPLFNAFIHQQRISYLDYILTYKLLVDYPTIDQAVAFFICHSILAAKAGHLCVEIGSSSIWPEPRGLWQSECAEPLSALESDSLSRLILQGFRSLPAELLTNVEHNQLDQNQNPSTPFCRYGHLVYLQRHWLFESLFFKHFKRLSLSKTRFELDKDKIKEKVEGLVSERIVLKEQAEAIAQGCLTPFSMITGGPGTGKTYTAGYLIRTFWESLSAEQKLKCRIVLAAPTGKAAANLQKSLNKVVGGLEGFSPLVARTLHSLLRVKNASSSKEQTRLFGDLIVIDESSMIDIKIMALLFEAIQNGSRLILLGDPHQLPSVEAGHLFADLIHLQSTHKELNWPCTHLSVCLRTELRSIVDFAALIKDGQADQALAVLKSNAYPGIRYIGMSNEKKQETKKLLSEFISLFPASFKKDMAPSLILNSFNSIRILSPIRKGYCGVDEINQLLEAHFSRTCMKEWLATPIIIVTNDYRQQLFNGETGVLIRKRSFQGFNPGAIGIEDYALFSSRDSEESVRHIPAILLPAYDYAYCLSVHKSQGSEFDRVVLMMPEGADLFGREIFYTAVTRARKQVDVYGAEEVIYKTIAQRGMRLSGLKYR